MSFSQLPTTFSPETTSFVTQIPGAYAGPFQSSPMSFTSSAQAQFDASISGYSSLPGPSDGFQWNLEDLSNDLSTYPTDPSYAGHSFAHGSIPASSPIDNNHDLQSLPSSGSDNGWAEVASFTFSPINSYADNNIGDIFNPGETLHIRSGSDSSQSEIILREPRNSYDSFEDISFPLPSPESDAQPDLGRGTLTVSPSAAVQPVPIISSVSPSRSISSQGVSSPPSRRQSRKSPTAKATKPVIRRASPPVKKDNEKRVGRRRGPLLPEQRKQAGVIRKLRACLRCKFLKKTCDKGEPCVGCQPAHARLWQVPCTRIDIKELAYFMKDWKVDFERHLTRPFHVSNIKGFSAEERSLYITHGYGFVIPVLAREVYVKDDNRFTVDWTESDHEKPLDFDIETAKLSISWEGISSALLSEYLDNHLDGNFEKWIDDFFEGTPFLTEILKTANRYYQRERLPVIRKALKLVLAYNLTQHFTMVEGLTENESLQGMIRDDRSKFRGKTVAPAMINHEIKFALASMWRELQKDTLEELSALYSSVYSGEKLKHWPTIFMLAAILLAVWEEMQFDCHFRQPVSEPFSPARHIRIESLKMTFD